MGALRTSQGYPGWLTRLGFGALGSALPLAGPFVVKFAAFEQAPVTAATAAAHTATLSVLVSLALSWALSVAVTVYMRDWNDPAANGTSGGKTSLASFTLVTLAKELVAASHGDPDGSLTFVATTPEIASVPATGKLVSWRATEPVSAADVFGCSRDDHAGASD